MELIYGTKNNAKIKFMQICLQRLKQEFGLEIIGLNQLDYELPDISETGNDPLENARIKAVSYYDIIKKPVFSCDSGLYFDGLPDALQPGLNVRTVNGKRLNDDEMIEYYSTLAKDNGGRIFARYINGICLIMDDLKYEHMGEDIATEKFIITATPHHKRAEGFPLDSLSVHIASNEYYYDLSNHEKDEAWHTSKGFDRFFREVIADKV